MDILELKIRRQNESYEDIRRKILDAEAKCRLLHTQWTEAERQLASLQKELSAHENRVKIELMQYNNLKLGG